MKIQILVYDGFDELDAIGPYEVLTNLSTVRREVDVALVAADTPGRVVGGHQLALSVDAVLGEDPDLVIVPGGGWADDGGAGVRQQIEEGVIPDRLRAVSANGATVAGVCTGAMLLAAAGLTHGRPATTHSVANAALADEGARIVSDRVVDDGTVLTCGGVTAGLDLALWIVEREYGSSLARGVAKAMEYERRGSVYISSRAAGAQRTKRSQTGTAAQLS